MRPSFRRRSARPNRARAALRRTIASDGTRSRRVGHRESFSWSRWREARLRNGDNGVIPRFGAPDARRTFRSGFSSDQRRIAHRVSGPATWSDCARCIGVIDVRRRGPFPHRRALQILCAAPLLPAAPDLETGMCDIERVWPPRDCEPARAVEGTEARPLHGPRCKTNGELGPSVRRRRRRVRVAQRSRIVLMPRMRSTRCSTLRLEPANEPRAA